jgi:hypothetical protein
MGDKITAVQWLDEQITICFENYSGTTLYHRIEDKIEQAKQMEMEQRVESYKNGYMNGQMDAFTN